jgi:peptidoglycan/LPS O-acetylase OafA/YrhL
MATTDPRAQVRTAMLATGLSTVLLMMTVTTWTTRPGGTARMLFQLAAHSMPAFVEVALLLAVGTGTVVSLLREPRGRAAHVVLMYLSLAAVFATLPAAGQHEARAPGALAVIAAGAVLVVLHGRRAQELGGKRARHI